MGGMNRSCQTGKIGHRIESGFYPKTGGKPLARKSKMPNFEFFIRMFLAHEEQLSV